MFIAIFLEDVMPRLRFNLKTAIVRKGRARGTPKQTIFTVAPLRSVCVITVAPTGRL